MNRADPLTALPYRGRFGEPRPAVLHQLPLPPAAMPARDRLRPLKAWRYVGVFAPELLLCLATVRIGPARQSFWAVWDRADRRLYEHTAVREVKMTRGRVMVTSREVTIELELDETDGIEAVCPSGESYAWTRKQGGIGARGMLVINGVRHAIDARAIVDDTAAYYARHTSWRWSAGVGLALDGRELAWNLVQGVNDPPRGSERTVWIDGAALEAEPVSFAADLSAVGELRFSPESVREQRQNLGLIRSRYRQPFGTFAGAVGGVELATGYGVMEEHEVWW